MRPPRPLHRRFGLWLPLLWLCLAGAARAGEGAPRLAQLLVERMRGQHARADDAELALRLIDELDPLASAPLEAQDAPVEARAAQRERWDALLELATLPCPVEPPPAWVAQVRAESLGRFEAALGGLGATALKLRAFLAADVLANPRRPAEARLATLELLGPRSADWAELGVLSAAREPNGPVGAAALRALVGRRSNAVDRLAVQVVCADFASGERRMAALEHLRALGAQLEPDLAVELDRWIGSALVGSDWRAASRACSLAARLPGPRIAPLLIEGLATWSARSGTRQSSLRVVHELAAALERVSGRRLGNELALWRSWWQVHRGRPTEQPELERTRVDAPPPGSSFFGLALDSDRVLFVLDRSGSMDEPFGRQNYSRWQAAVDEFERAVGGLGDAGRFGLVLFHADAIVGSRELKPARGPARNALIDWLRAQHPGGATNLEAGLDAMLPLDARGLPDPRAIEADTVVVLCDGQTGAPDWVDRWLERYNAEAQLRFHCVQLSEAGSGALERLAERSGGRFTLRMP